MTDVDIALLSREIMWLPRCGKVADGMRAGIVGVRPKPSEAHDGSIKGYGACAVSQSIQETRVNQGSDRQRVGSQHIDKQSLMTLRSSKGQISGDSP